MSAKCESNAKSESEVEQGAGPQYDDRDRPVDHRLPGLHLGSTKLLFQGGREDGAVLEGDPRSGAGRLGGRDSLRRLRLLPQRASSRPRPPGPGRQQARTS